jgi:hypothetical protein
VAGWRDTTKPGPGTSKLVLAALAAVLTFAGAYGFAASLGASTSGLGADSTVSASCGSGMTLAYTTVFNPAGSGYAVSGIELSNIPAGCRSKTFSATFYDRSGAAVGAAIAATLTGSGATQRIAVDPDSSAIVAGEVSGVSVVVS